MTTTMTAAAVRAALKTAGFSARTVSVCVRESSTYGAVVVTVRSALVDVAAVTAIVRPFHNPANLLSVSVRRDVKAEAFDPETPAIFARMAA